VQRFFYFVVRSCLGKLQYSADRLVAETGLIGQVQTELFGRAWEKGKQISGLWVERR